LPTLPQLSLRIPELPKGDRWISAKLESVKTHRRKLIGGGFIILAISLGLSASRFADAEAYFRFLHTHFPSRDNWKVVLAERQWGSPSSKDLKPIHQALRTLPALVDPLGAVWAGEDSDWLAVFPSLTSNADSTSDPQFFCRDCGKAPKSWSPLGQGWPAFDDALKWVDQRNRQRPQAAPKRRVLSEKWPLDPREIRY
jgi:hypothetical protein